MSDQLLRLPRDLYRADQVRQLDSIAIEQCEIPGFKLMQVAGAAAFEALMESWPQLRRVLVCTGSGNNGGDGYVIAGLAQRQGLQVRLFAIGDSDGLRGDAAEARDWAAQLGLEFEGLAELRSALAETAAHIVIVDALLGTGLDRPVTGDYASAINLINASGQPVLAVDIPSGLSADTGSVLGAAVRASVTITFIGMKQGLLTAVARDHVGRLGFASLDVPDQVYHGPASPQPSAHRIDIAWAAERLPPRSPSSHKGANGHVLVLGGDLGFGGAAIMAAESAARGGAGLVSLITRSEHRGAMMMRCPEVMVRGSEDTGFNPQSLLDRADVIVIGPGLGRQAWGQQLLRFALAAQNQRGIPLVIDADGLALLADRGYTATGSRRGRWVLTPHPGEAAILLDSTVPEVQQDRFRAVIELRERWGGACLLKGSGSLIAPESAAAPVYLCSEGNPGMASGGMGDVLSGLIGALLAQGLDLSDALAVAVCVHGEAADLAVADIGPRGLLATDLLAFFPSLLNPAPR